MFISISIFVRNKLFFIDASNMRKYLVLSFDGIPKWQIIIKTSVRWKRRISQSFAVIAYYVSIHFELKSQQWWTVLDSQTYALYFLCFLSLIYFYNICFIHVFVHVYGGARRPEEGGENFRSLKSWSYRHSVRQHRHWELNSSLLNFQVISPDPWVKSEISTHFLHVCLILLVN